MSFKHNEVEAKLPEDIFDKPTTLKNEMGLYEKEIEKLEEWTKLKLGQRLYDSNVDDNNKFTSTFDDKVKDKKQLLFIVETKDKNVFGCYIDSVIDKINSYITDSKAFVFSAVVED